MEVLLMAGLVALAIIVSLVLNVLVLGAAVGVPAVIPFVIGIAEKGIPRVARLALIAAPVSFALTIALVERAIGVSGWRAFLGVPLPIQIKLAFLPALALGLAGLAILAYGTRRKSDPTAWAGAWVVAAAIVDAAVAVILIGIAGSP